jgi:hypothetical protein
MMPAVLNTPKERAHTETMLGSGVRMKEKGEEQCEVGSREMRNRGEGEYGQMDIITGCRKGGRVERRE